MVGVGADDPETEGWATVFHSRLPEGSVLVKLGVSGSTAEEAIVEQVPQAEQLSPDIVTIWLVINDLRAEVSLEGYRSHLDQIVGRMAKTGAVVLVGNMPDLVGMPDFASSSAETLKEVMRQWNSAIEQVVLSHGAVLVDLAAAAEGFDEDKSVLVSAEDNFHPSTLGHLALAEIFFHYLDITSQAPQT